MLSISGCGCLTAVFEKLSRSCDTPDEDQRSEDRGQDDGAHLMAEVREERGQRRKDWHTETDFCPKAGRFSRNRPCLRPSNACSKSTPTRYEPRRRRNYREFIA